MSGARYGCLAVVHVQAHTDGFPDALLEDLCGAPVIARSVARVRACALVDETWVLVPEGPGAAALLAVLELHGIPGRRYAPADALGACLALARERGARHLVRVQAEQPFVDFDHIDLELGALRAFDADRVGYGEHTLARRSGPLAGLSACSVRALRLAQASDDPRDRAEVGEPFLARHAAKLRTVELELEVRHGGASAHLSLASAADLDGLRRLWSAIDHEGDGLFPLGRALRWLEVQSSRNDVADQATR